MAELLNLLSSDKKKEIAGFLLDMFRNSVKARTNQIEDKYRRWQQNYAAEPIEKVRTTPFYRASNFMPRLIAMHSDITHARIMNTMFSTRPFLVLKHTPIISVPHEYLETLQEWVNYTLENEIGVQAVMDQTLRRAIKDGTVITKTIWFDDEVFVGDEAGGLTSDEGFASRPIHTQGVEIKSIAFEDFWPYPITANDLSEVQIKFHRIRMTKYDVEARKGRWSAEAIEQMLAQPDNPENEPKRQAVAQESGIIITKDVDYPYHVIEAWFQYALSNGKTYKLAAVFNPFIEGEQSLLRLYFNPSSLGLDPFVDFRPFPRDGLFYGYAMPEILEQSQEEKAQIHNARRDASVIQNVPGWKKKKYAETPDPASEWYPGCTFVLDDMDDLQPIQFQVTYNGMIEEERYVDYEAERTTGISGAQQGMGVGQSGKRGIYNTGGTLAMLTESTRRLDIYIKRLRYPVHGVSNRVVNAYRDHSTDELFDIFGEKSDKIRQVLKSSAPVGASKILYDLACSDAGINREVDRQNALLLANTMGGYYRQIWEAAATVTQIPEGHPAREALLFVLDGAKDMVKRILFLFDYPDRDKLVPDLRAILGKGAGAAPGSTQPPGPPAAAGPVQDAGLQTLYQRLAQVPSPSLAGAGNGR